MVIASAKGQPMDATYKHKLKQMKEILRHELQFDENDLIANHTGRVTSAQRQRSRGIGFTIGITSILLFFLFLVWGTRLNDPLSTPLGFPIFCTALNAIWLPFVIVQQIRLTTQIAITVEAQIDKSFHHDEGYGTTYYLHYDDTKIIITKATYDVLIKGATYRLYVSSVVKKELFSLELIDQPSERLLPTQARLDEILHIMQPEFKQKQRVQDRISSLTAISLFLFIVSLFWMMAR